MSDEGTTTTYKVTTVYEYRKGNKWSSPGEREHVYAINYKAEGSSFSNLQRGRAAWTKAQAEAHREDMIEKMNKAGWKVELV